MKSVSFDKLDVFLAVAREGSLRAAAKALGLGPPAVSHRLKALEQELGIDLFIRTTRSVELTEAGRVLLDRAGPAVTELADAIEEAKDVGGSRKGTLRLTVPWSAYRIVIAPVLAAFREAHPDIRLEFSFDETLVDIIARGFHAGFRLGNYLPEGMVAVRLTPPLKDCYNAAPSYLDAYGRPRHPRDLFGHRCIRYRQGSSNRLADWPFQEDGRPFTVDPGASLVMDNFRAIAQAARDGHGIGWSLRPVIENDLRTGTLESILDDYAITRPPFHLYYPEQNRRLERLRVFIDFLKAARR